MARDPGKSAAAVVTEHREQLEIVALAIYSLGYGTPEFHRVDNLMRARPERTAEVMTERFGKGRIRTLSPDALRSELMTMAEDLEREVASQ